MLDLSFDCNLDGVGYGLVALRGASTELAAGFDEELAQELERAKARPEQGAWPERTKPVRELLRYGKYKPTGRGKPASEYLLRSAVQNKIPRVFALVDVLNLISLRYLLPISLIDLKKVDTDAFVLRRGHEGERYVFNSVGQEIELTDLLLVARKDTDQALANAVKDSMASKLSPEATDALAVVYAPVELQDVLTRATADLADRMKHYTHPQVIQHSVSGQQ